MAGTPVAGDVSATARVGRTGGYALAGAADEAELRALLRCAPMAGAVRLAFTREPDYFAADGLAGACDRTLIHRDEAGISGVARLSAQRLHAGGKLRRIGYLSELRLAPEARARTRLLRGGYAELQRHARALALEGCFTSIAADNLRARRVLEQGGRLGLPAYVPVAELVTLLFPVPRRGMAADHAPQSAGTGELTRFLQAHAVRAQLSLSWDAARWATLERHGLAARDFEVLREAGRIVAAGAVWDQRAFRQVRVCGYSGLLRWSRPVWNAAAAAGLGAPLPAPGAVLAQGMITGGTVAAPRYWTPLLQALLRSAAGRGLEWVAVAREARDPELTALRRLGRAREYRTRLYEVRWPDWPAPAPEWREGLLRPEVALL